MAVTAVTESGRAELAVTAWTVITCTSQDVWASDPGEGTTPVAMASTGFARPSAGPRLRLRLRDNVFRGTVPRVGVDSRAVAIAAPGPAAGRVPAAWRTSPPRTGRSSSRSRRRAGRIGVAVPADTANPRFLRWRGREAGGLEAERGAGPRYTIDESIPNVVKTLDALTGSPGLHYVDFLGRTVAW
ncbi:hypothetical protein FRAAL3099 [Frankia alni ACN14a]|uniref:Uncharacterized protein n=1 Tax=Frankia alni (strain DSM 45986 / CECT 9034 / ACN14a) TaxID=326424 RepID=Q0RL62_FRAAA|nr:hypothetical protein FRAAL3099 [Frankia alni ACN14a]